MATLDKEECDFLADSKYRAYQSQIDKALRSFENSTEWPDLISSLTKLNKVLLTNSRYNVIPRAILIGKRLAQCLHPALPSGVHLKVLETYDLIFKCIGKKHLANELFTYSAGLFPLLSYSAINVKPALLSLFESHFLPLNQNLRAALTGAIQGLLPGLEDTGIIHDRTNSLLERVGICCGIDYFYLCLWKCISSNSKIRFQGISYILSHYDKTLSLDEQPFLIGSDIDNMVTALSLSVQDHNILVQRAALDLIIVSLPMHREVLLADDRQTLVTSAIQVVLRRDMSLNRRLYAWLLGTDTSGAPLQSTLQRQDTTMMSTQMLTSAYFDLHSRRYTVNAARAYIVNALSLATVAKDPSSPTTAGHNNKPANNVVAMPPPPPPPPSSSSSDTLRPGDWKASNLRPYKILMNIIDRPEIGCSILEPLLIDVFRYTFHECKEAKTKETSEDMLLAALDQKSSPKAAQTEVIKTANLLFDNMEPEFIWDFIGKQFQQILNVEHNDENLSELITIVNFLLDKFPLEVYEETCTEYLPKLLTIFVRALTSRVHDLYEGDLLASFQLVEKLLHCVQPSTAGDSKTDVINGDNREVKVGDSTDGFIEKLSFSRKSKNQLKKTKKKKKNNNNNKNDSETPTVHRSNRGDLSNVGDTKEDDDDDAIVGVDAIPDKSTPTPPTNAAPTSVPTTLTTTPPSTPPAAPASRLHVCSSDLSPAEHPDSAPEGLNSSPKDPNSSHEATNSVSSPDATDSSRESTPIVDYSYALKVGHGTHSSDDESSSCYSSSSSCSSSSYGGRGEVGEGGEEEEQKHRKLPDTSSIANFTFMEQCITAFQSLYDSFARCRVIQMDVNASFSLDDILSTTQFPAFHCSDKIVSGFKVMCKLMTQFASFPVYKTGAQIPSDNKSLNDWLISLVITCCHGDNITIQSVAISTILELFKLGGSSGTTPSRHDLHSTPTETVNVVIGGDTLSRSQFGVLCKHERFFQQIGELLWRNLELEESCVALFYDLHRLSENSSGNCEDIIARSLLSDNPEECIKAHRKFDRIWEHVKEYTDDNANIFDRSLLTVVSSLKQGHVCHHLVECWLNKCYSGDDLARILSPIMMILLNADTARIALEFRKQQTSKHGSSKQLDQNNDYKSDLSEKRILGISSEKGCVTYHLSNKTNNDSSTTKSNNGETRVNSRDTPANTLVSLPTSKESPVQITRHIKLQEMDFEKVDSNDVCLTVNPLTGSNSDPQLSVLSKKTQRKSFSLDNTSTANRSIGRKVEKTEASGDEDTDSSRLLLPVNTANDHTDNSDSSSSADHDDVDAALESDRDEIYMASFTRETTPAESTKDICDLYANLESDNDNSLMAYRLIYHKSYDYRRIKYGFNTIDSLLSYRMVLNLVKTPLTQKLIRMQIARHRNSINGKNFFEDLKHKDLIKGHMYLELTFVTFLWYLRGHSEVNASVDLENEKIRLTACNTLCLLIKQLELIVNTSSMASYIQDTLNSVQCSKTILQCLVATVHTSSFYSSASDQRAHSNDQLQMKLLHAAQSLVKLEYRIADQSPGESQPNAPGAYWSRNIEANNNNLKLKNLNYELNAMTICQSMLTGSIISILRQQHRRESHVVVVGVVVSMMPNMGRCLAPVLKSVLGQLCRNIETLKKSTTTTTGSDRSDSNIVEPRNYLTKTLQDITSLVHYCLLSNGQFDQFCATTENYPVINISNSKLEPSSQFLEASKVCLQFCPRLVDCMCRVWQMMQLKHNHYRAKTVQKLILELLSPISRRHSTTILFGISCVWKDSVCRNVDHSDAVIPSSNEEQKILIEMFSSITPVTTFVLTVKQYVIRKQTTTENQDAHILAALQYCHAYLATITKSQLTGVWSSLVVMLRDCFASSAPRSKFTLLGILYSYVSRMPNFEIAKELKELQDLTQKYLESCSLIAGESLENTNWLSKNLAVKTGDSSPTSQTLHSLHALKILSEVTAPLLDIAFRSDQKDKVLPFLSVVLQNVFPYLRNHSLANNSSFKACSDMINSLSSYTYTRKVWKKEVFDLFLESSFFEMDTETLFTWTTVIDNLMLHDKTTFRDLLQRLVIAPSTNALNLFTSRESEMESRSSLLKRLNFAIFCSHSNQYTQYMPDIQERLADYLKNCSNSPVVQREIFHGFRVLILRVSNESLLSLWPSLVFEFGQVFVDMERHLIPNIMEITKSQLGNVDPSYALGIDTVVTSSSGGQQSYAANTLALYMSACRLLDLCLVLMSEELPQFQLYRWTFLGDSGESACYIPHVIRITRLMNQAYGPVAPMKRKQPGHLLLTSSRPLTRLADLHGFFVGVVCEELCVGEYLDGCNLETTTSSASVDKSNAYCKRQQSMVKCPSLPDFKSIKQFNEFTQSAARRHIENVVANDFIDPIKNENTTN